MNTMNANLLVLNKRCELFVDGQNVFAPVAHCPAAMLGDVLSRFAADAVTVRFNTTSDEKGVAADVRKYAKRLDAVAGWGRTEFSPQFINGFKQDVMVCTLTRRTA